MSSWLASSSSIPPRLLTAFGIVGLLGSWACFPPLALTPPILNRTPVYPSLPTMVPSAPVLSVAPMVGRRYSYRTTGEAAANLVVVVQALDGDAATYDSTLTPIGGSPTEKTGQVAKRENGVFWVLEGPNPVTKAIESYPEERLILSIGTLQAYKVVDGDRTYWFSDGIIVKASLPNGDTVLDTISSS